MEKSDHNDNVYAFNHNFKEIYISDVPYSERGIRAKYFCIGCKEQMQAVKSVQRLAHFRHHTHPDSPKRKCTYSDETYRHKLAKDILEIKKAIKVPKVYKYDQERLNPAILLKDSEIIHCHKVLKEHHLFEDVNGQLQIMHKPVPSLIAGLWVKPDVMFIDENGDPILLVEIVATHKVDVNKQVKYKRIGIDTVSVTIPKDSPESIENVFNQTSRTKWIYNYDEERTDYLRLPNSNSETISETDKIQRKLFEETYKCRKAEIGELIRSIERLLETELYERTERDLRSEIQRIERASKTAQSGLDRLRNEHRSRGIGEHSERRGKLRKSEKEFQEYFDDLETRYRSRKEELVSEEGEIEQESDEIEKRLRSIQSERRGADEACREEREAIRELEFDKSRIGERVSNAESQYNEDTIRLREQFDRDFEAIVRAIRERREALQGKDNEEGKRGESSVARDIGRERTNIDRTRSTLDHHRRGRAEAKSKFEESYERAERDIGIIREGDLEKIRAGDYRGSRWFDTEFERLGTLKESLIYYKKIRSVSRGIESLDR